MTDKKKVIQFLELFLGTILIHWLIVVISFYLNGDERGFFTAFRECFLATGDTPHYIDIAKEGYVASGDNAKFIVFYPLYPFLMRIVAFVVRDYFAAGIIISSVCTGISGYYLYRLVKEELGVSKAADAMLIYVLYPFGSFMVLVLTEGLSMMLVIMCLYYIRKKNWLAAGILGLFATLAKSQGIALFVPAVYEAIIYMKDKKKFVPRTLLVCMIPVGTFIYLIINKLVQGDWFAFLEHQSAEPWYNTSKWITENITNQYGMGIDYFGLGLLIYWIQIFLYFALIIVLFYGMKKKIPTSLIAFGGAHIFLSFLHGWLISGPRYMMGCVSMYIIYAAVGNKYIKGIIMLLFGMLTIFYTIGLWQGQAIM